MAPTFHYRSYCPKRQLDESDIVRCEQEIGRKLPPELRSFVLAHDSPAPEPAWIPLDSDRQRTWLGPILCLMSVMGPQDPRGGRGNDIECSTYASREIQKLPKHLIVFGIMISQPSTLLISTGAEDYGAVYAWRVGWKRFGPDQLTYLASSFSEFLCMLTEPPAEIVEAHRRWLAEKQAARQAGIEQRPPADEYGGVEARRWLRRNRHETPLAANHFPDRASALRFVEELYSLSATKVIVPESNIQAADDDGPYADALVVFLPTDPQKRADVCRRCEQELDEPQRIEPTDPNPIFLWWD